jgi:Arc/MetJ-type ribon-helix-helix transcriptional regulator
VVVLEKGFRLEAFFIGIPYLAIWYYNLRMKAISIKLPDSLFHDLANRASSSASSQSEIIRSALTAYLHGEQETPKSSCAERARRWIGIMDGPVDLSSNSKHLKGFGE